MYWRRELNCFYIVIVLLEIVVFDMIGAVDSTSSIVTQNYDDLRTLDVCTSRNQQRLGSVYGNITRHHKKVHKRRTTTQIPTTTFSRTTIAIEDPTTISSTIYVMDATKPPKLPKPLRLSALLEGDSENVHNLDINVDETHYNKPRERHHMKHRERERVKEMVLELDEASLTSNHNKVKKMYRDSSTSNVNKLNSKMNKNGIFLTDNCTTVVAQIGTTAIMHCEVSDITENTVTWIRRKDYSLLSVGLVTYSADNRFFSAHGRHVKDWALHIRFATSADAGYYECQVPTHPPTSIFFKLVLVAAYAEIMGEAEKIIHEGSMLRLVCVVRRSTEPPSYVFWYFENRMINYDLNGVSVHNGRQTSELVIGKAESRHAGNYTCVPANAKAASVTVHVVQSETPAAMQHGNSLASSSNINTILLLLLITLSCLIKV